jgi:PmbA protein
MSQALMSITPLALVCGDQGSQSNDPIKDGVYITDLVGLHAGVKTVSGEFSLQASGFRIDQGKRTTPVKMIVVSGNFFECLMNIKGFASDLYFNLSNIGAPSVYIESLMIGGE